ncbi:hypothetical protein ACRE_030630 [Hapsidospora chrysogenum ATCC 11550]|uniref:Uncharacterized protein n=1 Tax=Hapsidospora chrysogenum (strain ATCC 11550 / CBS 779.69 / DSM 880 / IAM 14645 / JCM 23072 / IMI 49137) TaxID=857340 RepID=A0A086T9R9_HAPC1|nr:hypothetical protein ACRE_030630 [Hapsidospora chrysogenum ATCC 11550]
MVTGTFGADKCLKSHRQELPQAHDRRFQKVVRGPGPAITHNVQAPSLAFREVFGLDSGPMHFEGWRMHLRTNNTGRIINNHHHIAGAAA